MIDEFSIEFKTKLNGNSNNDILDKICDFIRCFQSVLEINELSNELKIDICKYDRSIQDITSDRWLLGPPIAPFLLFSRRLNRNPLETTGVTTIHVK